MSDQLSVNRRGLFLGAGVAALAATSLAGTGHAQAVPVSDDGTAPARPHRVHPDGSPVTMTIASPPTSGFVYRSVCMYDFEPFDPAGQKTWGGFGTYSAGTATVMRATMEIPPGVLVRDVEYYVYNNSGSSVSPDTYLYVPGQGTIYSIGASVAVPSAAGVVSATRATIASSSWGPYPSGSRLLVSVRTSTDGKVQINGARVGMTQGAGAVGLLPAPQRIYDSRQHAKLARNETRTITFPAAAVPPGTAGVLVNITAVHAVAKGYVNAWPANAAEPPTSAINYPVETGIANAIIVGVSAGRQIKLRSSAAVHVIIDLTGTVS